MMHRTASNALRVAQMDTGMGHLRDSHGFTLIELILSMALIATLAGITAGVYYATQVKNGLDIAATTLAQGLRRAQSSAQVGDSDSGWGMYVQSGNITLFKGSTYATRDTTADETTSYASNITASGTKEIDFAKFTGDPAATATFTLSTSADTKTITVNSKGMVSL